MKQPLRNGLINLLISRSTQCNYIREFRSPSATSINSERTVTLTTAVGWWGGGRGEKMSPLSASLKCEIGTNWPGLCHRSRSELCGTSAPPDTCHHCSHPARDRPLCTCGHHLRPGLGARHSLCSLLSRKLPLSACKLHVALLAYWGVSPNKPGIAGRHTRVTPPGCALAPDIWSLVFLCEDAVAP